MPRRRARGRRRRHRDAQQHQIPVTKPVRVMLKPLTVKVKEQEIQDPDLERLDVALLEQVTQAVIHLKVKRQEVLQQFPRRNMLIEPTPRLVPPLPPEIIQMILDKVTDPQALINCSRAAPNFSEALGKRKPIYLFAHVFPHLFPLLPLQEVLKLRRVCQQWQHEIDLYIENPPSQSAYCDAAHLRAMNTSLTNRRNLGATRILRFSPWTRIAPASPQFPAFRAHLQNLNDSGRTPFFGNALDVTIERQALEAHAEAHNANITLLMHEFGEHIHHLCLHFNVANSYHFFVAVIFTAWILILTPNLQSLRMEMTGTHDLPYSTEILRILREAVHHYANTPNLRVIEIFPGETDATRLFAEVVFRPFHDHVTKLTLPYWPELVKTLPCLKELKLCKVQGYFQLLNTLKLDAPSLEKLTMSFDYLRVNVVELNKVVSKYSLRVLALEWRNRRRPALPDTGTFEVLRQVPTLHTLYMQHSRDVSYCILEWFPNLRFLYLTEVIPLGMPLEDNLSPSRRMLRYMLHRVYSCYYMVAGGDGKHVKNLHESLSNGDVEKSNIWEVLTKLEFVAYQKVRNWSVDELQDSLVRPRGDGEQGMAQEMKRKFWERPRRSS